MKHSLIILFLFAISQILNAQKPEPPLPVEFMTGSEGVYFQSVIKKSFKPESKFAFFSIATFMSGYENEPESISIAIPVQIQYELGSGFSAFSGGRINNVVGFSPLVGLQHNIASRELLMISSVNYFVNEDHDLQLFGLYEYKPALANSSQFYTRMQFLYNHNPNEGQHNRSYLYFRLGIKNGKLAYGIGANLDRFGPFKDFIENYGLFMRWDL